MAGRKKPQHIRRKSSIIKLFNLQGGLCHYCGCRMTLFIGRRNTATRDHVIPRSAGGPTQMWNLVAACHDCNQAKGSTPYEVFTRRVA